MNLTGYFNKFDFNTQINIELFIFKIEMWDLRVFMLFETKKKLNLDSKLNLKDKHLIGADLDFLNFFETNSFSYSFAKK